MFPSNLCFFLFAGQNQKRNATSRENSERPATAHNKGSIYYRFHFNLNTQNWRHDWVQLHPSNLLTISTIYLITSFPCMAAGMASISSEDSCTLADICLAGAFILPFARNKLFQKEGMKMKCGGFRGPYSAGITASKYSANKKYKRASTINITMRLLAGNVPLVVRLSKCRPSRSTA